ncbi:MAG: dTMP kinase [Candidatus Methanofastidiosa archaeon]|nr:dTMP kinase [Candidatus Methanofastidiosa archaeon]
MSIKRNDLAGKFIVIEGIDGSGLSTQASRVSEILNGMGHQTYKTKEPSDGPVGGLLRLALTHRIDISPGTFALLFAADRLDHLENEIIPKLSSGINVISDRYCFSNFAYQGTDIDTQWLVEINSHCMIPDITIFLDVDPTVCKRRIEPRMREEYFEKLPRLRMIRESFLKVIRLFNEEQGANIAIVNGNNPIEDVTHDILEKVLKLF